MPSKKHYDAILQQVRDLQDNGEYQKAKLILDGLALDPDNHLMGPLTALGLPRRLHSAMLRLAKAEGDDLKRIGYQYHLVPPPGIWAKYGVFDTDECRAIAAANRQDVPRIIHQIWIGSEVPPVSTEAWSAYAATQGYEYRLWRENDLRAAGVYDYPVFSAMLDVGDYPGAVDVARYVILDKIGGIYLDCDWFPARDDLGFHDLLPLVGLAALAEDTPRQTGAGSLLLTNSFIAVPPGHPVLRRILDVLPDVWRQMPGAPAWWSTGPLIFTIVCRGGAVSIPDARFVAGNAPRRAPLETVQALCAAARETGSGLLVAWKSW